MAQFKTYEHTVGTHWLSPLFNDDNSGLDASEVDQLANWLNSLGYGPGHWSIANDDPEYGPEVDFNICDITDMYSDTVTLLYHELVR